MGLLARIKSWAADETLTAATLNAEFNNIINNLDPDSIEDASSNAAGMQATKDPYPGAVADAPASLREEVQELRYQIKAMLGEAQWYIDPDDTIVNLANDALATGGHVTRPLFDYTATCKVVIYAGAYEIGNKLQRFTSATTIETTNTSDKTWHYFYLDESAVTTAATDYLTSAEIYTSTTAPTWSDTLMGWYNDSDRCIFGVMGDSTDGGQLLDFIHDGGDYVQLGTNINNRDLAALNSTDFSVEVTMTRPHFSNQVEAWFRYIYSSTQNEIRARTKGTSGGGAVVGAVSADDKTDTQVINIMTDSTGKIQVASDTTAAEQAGIYTIGWFFPRGL